MVGLSLGHWLVERPERRLESVARVLDAMSMSQLKLNNKEGGLQDMASTLTANIDQLGLRLRQVDGKDRSRDYSIIIEVVDLLEQLSRKVDKATEKENH